MAMRTPPLLGNAYGKGYGEAGANRSRRALKGFTAESFSAREDIDMHVQLLRERSRILYMSSPVATSAIKTLRTNVVGEGLTLKSRVNRNVLEMTDEEADAFERHVEEEFSLWAENKNACDATGMNDFYSMTQLVLVTQCLSGDAIVIPPPHWHAGDGASGTGNTKTIAIEICVNPDDNFKEARKNAAELTASILKSHGMTSVIDGTKDKANGNVFQHNTFSPWGKNCPQTIRNSGLWESFLGEAPPSYRVALWTPHLPHQK